MIDLNLVGVLETVRVFLPALERPAAAISVLISSLGARVTFPGYAVYGATKAAVSYLADAWRAELAPPASASRRSSRASPTASSRATSRMPGQADELAGMFDQIPALSAERRGRPADLHRRASRPRQPAAALDPARASGLKARLPDAQRLAGGGELEGSPSSVPRTGPARDDAARLEPIQDPTSPKNEPACTFRSACSTAVWSPNALRRPVVSSAGVTVRRGPRRRRRSGRRSRRS